MNIHEVPVEQIIVPSERFREADKQKVGDIAESLARFGQLQPVILQRDNTLVDGLHRLTAVKQANLPVVQAVYRDEMDELFLRELELEVNIQRKEMTWQERTRAIASLHDIRVQRDPNWSQSQTQELTGAKRQADISEAIQITKMAKLFPEIGKAKSKNQALSWIKAKAASVMRVQAVKHNKIDFGNIEQKIAHGDSVEIIKQIPDHSFNAIITDPPFGIDYDNKVSGSSQSLSAYEDSAQSYERLLSMAPDLYRVLKPDGWLIWFFGISWYERCKEVFRAAGFIVDEIPIVWDRSDAKPFTIRPDRYFGRSYDVALHCIKGDPQMIQRSKSNVLRIPPVDSGDKELTVERPVELYAELIRRLTVPKEIVADFFVGSGSCPAAAAMLGRDYFGVERDAERRAVAIKKIHSYTPDGR